MSGNPPNLISVERDWGRIYGVRRHVLAAVDCPRAVAVELHGSGLDPERQYRASGLATALARERIATVIPEGGIPFQLLPVEIEPPGYVWNVPDVPLPLEHEMRPGLPDDVAWICDLADHVRGELGIPSSPIMIVGYSAGARLASHIVVRERIEWAAAAFVAGLRPSLGAVRPMPPTISFHGREDRFAPYGGGQPPRWAESVDEAARLVALQGGAASEAEITLIAGGSRHLYTKPDGDVALIHHELDGTGHAWPNNQDAVHCSIYGGGCDQVSATTLITEFFASLLARLELSTSR